MQRLAESVAARLSALGVPHTTRLSLEAADSNWRGNWRLSVTTDDGCEDLVFGRHGRDTIGVIPEWWEDVSVPLATEYVLMSLDLNTEQAWWDMFKAEQAAGTEARRLARSERWRSRLGLSE